MRKVIMTAEDLNDGEIKVRFDSYIVGERGADTYAYFFILSWGNPAFVTEEFDTENPATEFLTLYGMMDHSYFSLDAEVIEQIQQQSALEEIKR